MKKRPENDKNPRVAMLWYAGYQKQPMGAELMGEHLKRAFPDALMVTVADAPLGFLKNLKFRWFRLDDILRAVAAGRYFSKVIKREKIDVAVVQGMTGLYLTFFRPKIPVIHVLNMSSFALHRSGAVPGWKNNVSGYFWALLEKMSGWRKDSRVTVGEDVRKAMGGGYDVIPLAVDTDIFRPGEKVQQRAELGLDAHRMTALFVGRFEYAKGYDIVLEVAQAFPEITFVLVSPRPAETAGKNIIVRSRLMQEEIAKYYRAADFLLCPSRFEAGLGYTILEAMASNLPLVVNGKILGGMPKGADIGVIVDGGDASAYTKAIRKFTGAPFAVNSKETVRQYFSLEQFERRWRQLVLQLAGKKQEAIK